MSSSIKDRPFVRLEDPFPNILPQVGDTFTQLDGTSSWSFRVVDRKFIYHSSGKLGFIDLIGEKP